MFFDAIQSEITAFVCYCEHCFHVVRSRRWSRLWSESKLHIFFHLTRAAISSPRWLFYCNHYTIKERIFQVSSRLNICTAVIKDYDAPVWPRAVPSDKQSEKMRESEFLFRHTHITANQLESDGRLKIIDK